MQVMVGYKIRTLQPNIMTMLIAYLVLLKGTIDYEQDFMFSHGSCLEKICSCQSVVTGTVAMSMGTVTLLAVVCERVVSEAVTNILMSHPRGYE